MKHPEQVNLGGLWLMNPHAPRCTQTNLHGLEQLIEHGDRGTLFADSASVLPVAWKLDVPPGLVILTGIDPNLDDTPYEVFRGPHILRQQKFYKDELWDGASHPWHLRDSVGGALAQREIVHAVWYDSLVRRVNTEDDPPPTLLQLRDPHRWPFRGFCWSLYYGRPLGFNFNGTTIGNTHDWWLVAALEPSEYDPFDTNPTPPFVFFSLWRFSHPLADDGTKLGGFSISTLPLNHVSRFNPLGKNVFRRAQSDGVPESQGADELTIEPFYG
jgi:hypothetical protein